MEYLHRPCFGHIICLMANVLTEVSIPLIVDFIPVVDIPAGRAEQSADYRTLLAANQRATESTNASADSGTPESLARRVLIVVVIPIVVIPIIVISIIVISITCEAIATTIDASRERVVIVIIPVRITTPVAASVLRIGDRSNRLEEQTEQQHQYRALTHYLVHLFLLKACKQQQQAAG